MGINNLTTYLEKHPKLKHQINFYSKSNKSLTHGGKTLIIWDASGFLRQCYGCYSREAKLLFDFKVLDAECRRIIETFNRFGFEIVAFIDGRFCREKVKEKTQRKRKLLKKVRKFIKTLKELHHTESAQQRKALEKKIGFVPSTNYRDALECALTANGCPVYRGTSPSDFA